MTLVRSWKSHWPRRYWMGVAWAMCALRRVVKEAWKLGLGGGGRVGAGWRKVENVLVGYPQVWVRRWDTISGSTVGWVDMVVAKLIEEKRREGLVNCA